MNCRRCSDAWAKACPCPIGLGVKGENNYVGRIVDTAFSLALPLLVVLQPDERPEPSLPGQLGARKTTWSQPYERFVSRGNHRSRRIAPEPRSVAPSESYCRSRPPIASCFL